MGLSPEEQAQLDALTAKANEPDAEDDDFEVEIYSPTGHGARLPYRKGRKYLQDNFGIDLDPDPGTGDTGGAQGDAGTGKPAGGKAKGSAKAPADQGDGQDPGAAEGRSHWSRRSGARGA